MEKSIIQINEEQLKSILADAVTSVLNGITHRMATTPIISKMTYRVLTQSVFDNVGENIVLYFGRPEEDFTTSNVDFYFRELRLLTPKRFVLEGYDMNIGSSPRFVGKTKPRIIQIDYRFDQQKFYEAVYCANGTVRDLKLLKLDYAGPEGKTNIDTVKKLIQFLTMCLYSIEDGQTDILNKAPTYGKTIYPITNR